jgi:hypothetical protein
MRSRLFAPTHYFESAETDSREEYWVKLSLCPSLAAASTICKNFVQRASRFGDSNSDRCVPGIATRAHRPHSAHHPPFLWRIDAEQSNRTLICNIAPLDVH